jgi:hypothetical protein
VIATLALFLVVAGGGAYAAKKLGKNVVKTKNIKNAAVTKPKIAAQAVDTGNLVDKAAKQGKIGQNAIITEKLSDGAVTPGKTTFAATSGRVASNPASGSASPTLLSIGGVTVTGSCFVSTGEHSASVAVTGPATSILRGIAETSGPPAPITTSLPATGLIATGQTAAFFDTYLTVDVITPTNTIALSAHVAINTQGAGCVFSANAIAG